MRPSITLIWLCLLSMLWANPSDFDTKATKRVYLHFVPSSKPKAVFMILKQVPLHSTSFNVLLAQNVQTQEQEVSLWDPKSSLMLAANGGLVLPDPRDYKQILELRQQAAKHNAPLQKERFISTHAKDFKAFIKALPPKNIMTLESPSKHPSKEVYYIAQGALPKEVVAKLEKLAKEARVHVVLLGEYPIESMENTLFLGAALCLQYFQQNLQHLSTIARLQQCTRLDPDALDTDALEYKFKARITQNIKLTLRFGLAKNRVTDSDDLAFFLPLFYTLPKKD
ncbi:hypothetical protein [Helicobacter salomonis]|uniref:hypothetical protein n=1 Tax=Helicobacter salomonis TaxID=56878 RepID=UPI001F15C9E8|nr:hypothetical protein [Helicobacter salomonis]